MLTFLTTNIVQSENFLGLFNINEFQDVETYYKSEIQTSCKRGPQVMLNYFTADSEIAVTCTCQTLGTARLKAAHFLSESCRD